MVRGIKCIKVNLLTKWNVIAINWAYIRKQMTFIVLIWVDCIIFGPLLCQSLVFDVICATKQAQKQSKQQKSCNLILLSVWTNKGISWFDFVNIDRLANTKFYTRSAYSTDNEPHNIISFILLFIYLEICLWLAHFGILQFIQNQNQMHSIYFIVDIIKSQIAF